MLYYNEPFSNRMSVIELEQFIQTMRESVRTKLQSVGTENVSFIAHILAQELYNVPISQPMKCSIQFLLSMI